MHRTVVAYLLVFFLLALFGGVAWLTRFPEAEVLRRAESWPWVGPAAARFRAVYGQRDRPAAPATEAEEIWIRADGAADAADAADRAQPIAVPRTYRRQVWALGGMELKAEPSANAATLYTFENLSRAGKIEQRGDWYRVDYHGRVGWVLLEGYDEHAEIPYGEAPEPPRPLPARAPDEESLAAARKYLGEKERVLSLGPHALYTDCRDDALISYLDSVAGRLEAVYAGRYGRQPVGTAAEAVVLFQSDIAYRLVQQHTEHLAGLNSSGHNAHGLAVLYAGGRSRAAVAATLIHELVHSLNRRALGPQLPPWLDEGIADDLALSEVDSGGRIDPGKLGGGRRQQGDRWLVEGGQASLLKLREAALAGRLPPAPELIGTDWESFVRAPDIQLNYAAAAFWVRFLIDGDGGRHAAGFRAFLAAVAGGEPPDAETLQAAFGEEWSVLDAHFRAWIEDGALKPRL